jgi:cob(I)alamin adenosyltransferase
MKLYTKTGDGGMTSLFGGTRVPKHHIRIQSYGTVDELNSWVGVLRDQDIGLEHRERLVQIQDRLFVVGAMLALDPEKSEGNSSKKRMQIPEIKDKDTLALEEEIDRLDNSLPPMTHFILPGGHPAVSFCHVARTVCRRAERMTTLLSEQSPVNQELMAYLNRLSDYFFVLSRKLAQENGAIEEKWIPKIESE